MCKLNKKSGLKRIDPCMVYVIKILNRLGYKTLACCCGHGKYAPTIVVRSNIIKTHAWELLSETYIPRTNRFYKKDREGYYYIPECIK